MDRDDKARLIRIEEALLNPQTGLVVRVNNHGNRIASLERWRTFVKGAGYVVGAVIAAMGLKLKVSQG